MPRFDPFPALRPPGHDLDARIAPPYDVIGDEERAELEARDEHNAVHLELPRDRDEHDRYTEASCLLRAWLADGSLVLDDDPAFYAYEMTADGPAGPTRTRGVLGALTLEAPGKGILPHEQTTSKDVSDRLSMLSTCRANLSPIWALTPTEGLGELAAGGTPLAEATDDDGVRHALRRIDDPAAVAAIQAAVAAAPLVIADGHHRFEVANRYRAQDDAAPGADAILTLVVELAPEELTVRAIHRVVDDAAAVDALLAVGTATPLEIDLADADALRSLEHRLPGLGGFAVLTAGGSWLVTPADADPDLLDSERVAPALEGRGALNQHDAARIGAAVAAGAAAGVLLRPATVDQIAVTGRGGKRMPAKTTFFWPKPRTGFAFRLL